MVEFIRRHAIALMALLLIAMAVFTCAQAARHAERLEAADAFEDSAASFRKQREALARDTARLHTIARGAEARTDSALAAIDRLQAQGPRIITRWRELPDTASVATVRAAADSAIAHLTEVGERWRVAFMARTEELRIAQELAANLQHQLDAADAESRNLIAANMELRAAAEHRPSAFVPIALIGGGTAIGAAVGGLEGAAWGAAGGTAATVAVFGTRELLRVRLPALWPPWRLFGL